MAVCYEALCGAAPWPTGPPLDVEICTEGRSWGRIREGLGHQPAHMWVGGVEDAAGQARLLGLLAEAGLGNPTAILRVAGQRPGADHRVQ